MLAWKRRGRSTTPAWGKRASGCARARVQSLPEARTLSKDDPERKRLFAQARVQHVCSDYALQTLAKPLGHCWLGEHLDSHTIQKLASRAYGAANRLLVGRAKRVRFKGKAQLDSVEGKVNTSGIRWCSDHVEWVGLALPALLDTHDPVVAHGLSCPVKYVRLVRRRVGLRNRFYAQLVCQGTPYRKPQHQLGSGIVGLDLGPSTLAVVAEQAALLQPFCPEVLPNWRHLRRLDRQLDRQRRANNPANYDERGRVKKGRKRWKTSKRQRRVAGAAARGLPQAGGHAQAQPRAARPSGAGPGRPLPAGADLLSGLAEAIWALGRSQCPWNVCLAPVSPGGHVLAGRWSS